jgi:hypothetical protein
LKCEYHSSFDTVSNIILECETVGEMSEKSEFENLVRVPLEDTNKPFKSLSHTVVFQITVEGGESR